jgi:hypothetical protein
MGRPISATGETALSIVNAKMRGCKPLKQTFYSAVRPINQHGEIGALLQRSPAPVFQRTATRPMLAMSNIELYATLDAQDTVIGFSSASGITE